MRVIYSKTYPKMDVEAMMQAADAAPCPEGVPFEVFCEELRKEVERPIAPRRRKQKEAFIQAAIEFSEIYELDAEITEKPGCVDASFFFNDVACIGGLKDAIALAEDITVFSDQRGYDILVSLMWTP